MGELITFAIRIPLEIDLVVDLRIDRPRFMVFGEIALRATARAVEPLLLILDFDKPRPRISPSTSRPSPCVPRWCDHRRLDAEIKRFIAAHVSGEIDSPASQKAKVIDVADSIDVAWTGV